MDKNLIKRSALGRVARVGDLYDVRTEKFSEQISIFNDSPPKSAIQIKDEPFTEIQYINSDALSEKFDKLNISIEMMASIMGGLVSPEGHGKYISLQKQSRKSVQSSLFYSFQIKLEQLDLFNRELRDNISLDALDMNIGTHIVVGVSWGANSIVTLEHSNTKDEEKNLIQDFLNDYLYKLANQINENNSIDNAKIQDINEDISIKVFGDILTHGNQPQTLAEIMNYLNNIPRLLRIVNKGKGKQIKYNLVPINILMKHLNVAIPILYNLPKQLKEQDVKNFIHLFDEMSTIKQELNDLEHDLCNNKHCFQIESIKSLKQTKINLENAETELRLNLGKNLIVIRSGNERFEKLEEIRENYLKSDISLEKVKLMLNIYEGIKEKIVFVDFLIKEGITYIGNGASIELKQLKKTEKEIFILFFGVQYKNLEIQSWSSHRDHYLSLLKSAKISELSVNKEQNQKTTPQISTPEDKPETPTEDKPETESEDTPKDKHETSSEDRPKEKHETPSEDTPKDKHETPSEDTLKDKPETPSEDTPKDKHETPSEDTPKDKHETPSEDTPKDKHETPSEDTLKDKPETPSEDTLKDKPETPSEDTPKDKHETPSEDTPKDKHETPSEDTLKDKPETPSEDTLKDKHETPSEDTPKDKHETPSEDTLKDKPETQSEDTPKDKHETPSEDTLKDKHETPSEDTHKDKPETPSEDTHKDKPETPSEDTPKDKPETPTETECSSQEYLREQLTEQLQEKLSIAQQSSAHNLSKNKQYNLQKIKTIHHISKLTFIAVDLDVRPEIAQNEGVGEGIRICHFKNGKYISLDVLADHLKNESTCFAKSNEQKVFCLKPNKKVVLQLRCPGSIKGDCEIAEQKWVCQECKEIIDNGFDGYFYCKCGRASNKSFLFKCKSNNHRNGFVGFEENELLKLIEKILPLEEINILILGVTGVGKSTWINGICNYLTYDSLELAAEGKLLSVTSAKFSLTDDDDNVHHITIGSDEKEVHIPGQSVTQQPRAYEFSFGNKLLRLIDTPGIGDTRGLTYDKENFDAILHYLGTLDYLNGICILLKPNESRLDVLFEFCIKELLTHLHRSASENIVFCFTNARGTYYKPGDTRGPLNELLRQNKVKIVLNPRTMYCMDNESFRFLCAVNHGIIFKDNIKKSFSESWNISVDETKRLFIYIMQLKPHLIKDTITLNNARRSIISLTKPIADISQNIQRNISLVEDKRKEVIHSKLSEAELAKSLYMETFVLKPVDLGHPRTVCTNKKCVTYVNKEVKYVTHCHPHCYLSGVKAEIIGNPDLQKCKAMRGGLFCTVCKCKWDQHMHLTYEQISEELRVIDETVKTQIYNKETLREKKEKFIEKMEILCQELEEEQQKIMEVSVKFGGFLSDNAITPYNDALGKYLDLLIKKEEEKAVISEDNQTLNRMKDMRRAYDEEVEALKRAMAKPNAIKLQPNDIKILVDQLFSLKHNGNQLKEAMEKGTSVNRKMIKYHQSYQPMTQNINKQNFLGAVRQLGSRAIGAVAHIGGKVFTTASELFGSWL